MRRTLMASAGPVAVAALAVSACGSASQGNPPWWGPQPTTATSMEVLPPAAQSEAGAYVTSHPVPVKPGMSSGILVGQSEAEPYDRAAQCGTASRQCYGWTGQVAVGTGRVVQIGAPNVTYPCFAPDLLASGAAISSVRSNLGLGDYIYFAAGNAQICPPADVAVIARAVVGGGN